MKYNFCLLNTLFSVLFSTILCGCISDAGSLDSDGTATGTAVKFPTTIAKTRVANDRWEWGDDIGVYMIPAANPPECDWSSVELYAANKRYIHDMEEGDLPDNAVVFSGSDTENTILWPGDDRKFDIVAYYPWTASITNGYLYSVNLSDQTPQKSIDLMWSDNIRNQSSGSPALSFTHKLTKLIFNVTDTTGASLVGVTATFEGLPVTASFDLASGTMVSGTEGNATPFEGVLTSTDDGDDNGVDESAVIEAIVLPGSRLAGYTVTFLLENGEKAVFRVELPVYVAGSRYIYDINLTPPVNEGEGASFGVDGGLEQISQWGEGDEGEYPGDIPKNNETTSGEGTSAPWRTAPGIPFNGGSSVNGGMLATNSYALRNSEMTITKPDCEGIASVTVNMKGPVGSTIRSVTVGTQHLVIDHDNNSSTSPQASLDLPNTTEATDFIFRTADGMPCSGDVTIVIGGGNNTANIYGFGTNTDIAGNNP